MHIGDIKMWTMCEEFFQNYPQLRDDIPADSVESLPLVAPLAVERC